MTSSEKRIAANRRNALQSTGPTSPQGKAIAAQNSLKHGLLAKEVVVDAGEGAESQEQFDALLSDLKDQFQPQGTLEEMLVEKIAVAYWRLRRAHRYEVGLIRQELDTASDNYCKPEPFSLSKPPRRSDEIDAEIEREKAGIASWQKDKSDLTRMRRDGTTLESIYNWDPNWEALQETLPDDLPDDVEYEESEEPQDLPEFLSKTAGWSDDQIWQALIDTCDRLAAQHRKRIAALEKEKQGNGPRLEVFKRLHAVPNARDLDRLLKYEGAIERQFYKAIDQLERLQRLRAGDNVPAPVNVNVTLDGENPGGPQGA